MKLKQLLIITLIILSAPTCLAISFGGSNFSDTSATRSYVKFAPQQNAYNYNRFIKQKKNYIYSPQQAQYYGYRTIRQQQTTPSQQYQRTYTQTYSGYGR